MILLLLDGENPVWAPLAQSMSLIMHRNTERNFFLEHFAGNMVSGTGYCHCFQNTGRRVGEWLSLRKPSSILLALEALPYYVKGRVSAPLESCPAWFLLGIPPLWGR